MCLWSTISAASCQETLFFPKQRSSTLRLTKTNLQKPSCWPLVYASQSASCHSFAYGRTATASKNFPASTWFSYLGKTSPFAPSASALQLSATLDIPPQLGNSPWYSSVVILICMLCFCGCTKFLHRMGHVLVHGRAKHGLSLCMWGMLSPKLYTKYGRPLDGWWCISL